MKTVFKKIMHLLPDKWHIQCQYFYHFHKFANLKNPKSFNEKLQWLKLYDRKPLYTMLVDKYAVKKWVADKIGQEYVIPTLGVWDKAEAIDFDRLPNKFVLKCNHSGGGNVFICKEKREFDIVNTVKGLAYQLKHSNYWYGREWPYKDISPKIIAEEYLEDPKTHTLHDYKFYCFNGKVSCVMVCLDRNLGDTKFYFFDSQWNLLRFNKRGQAAPKDFTIEKPKDLDSMFKLAESLSEEIPFVRVDLYNCDGKIYFGELTLYPSSGFDENILPEANLLWGQALMLPEK